MLITTARPHGPVDVFTAEGGGVNGSAFVCLITDYTMSSSFLCACFSRGVLGLSKASYASSRPAHRFFKLNPLSSASGHSDHLMFFARQAFFTRCLHLFKSGTPPSPPPRTDASFGGAKKTNDGTSQKSWGKLQNGSCDAVRAH